MSEKSYKENRKPQAQRQIENNGNMACESNTKWCHTNQITKQYEKE